MRANNPRLRQVWAAHQTAEALAGTATPLTNPTLTAGALYFGGNEIVASQRYGGEAALGWSVPLFGTQGIQDDLNAQRSWAAFIEAIGAERQEYLHLRADLLNAAFLFRSLEARRQVAAAASAAAETSRNLIEAAQATALDLCLLELEAARDEDALILSEAALLDGQARLAARCGLELAAFATLPTDVLPPIPDNVPTLEDLQAILLREDPLLANLKALYLIAENELRLEVARQFPSLELGPSFEFEEGVRRFGFPLGIELPIFDGNQQGIAEARVRRDEIRVQFESAVSARLAVIETIRTRLLVTRRRLDFARSRIAPLSREAIELARRALPAGALNALQFLEVLRADATAQVDLVEAEKDAFAAWTDLEQACGAPLLQFPGEPGLTPLPSIPENEHLP